MSLVKLHRARNKSGRQMIEQVFAYVTRIDLEDVDNVTGDRRHVRAVDIEMVREFIRIDGRAAELWELDECTFVYLCGGSARGVKRYLIHTAAMME